MTMAATPLQRMLRQAARRDLIALSVRRVGVWLAVALGLALAALAVDRWFGLGIPPWLYFAAMVAGVVGGVTHAAFTRRDRLNIAVTLDHSLKLKDRIGSALAVDRQAVGGAFNQHDDGFAELV